MANGKQWGTSPILTWIGLQGAAPLTQHPLHPVRRGSKNYLLPQLLCGPCGPIQIYATYFAVVDLSG